MPFLVFNKCCGFVDLKIGSLILGYLNLGVALKMASEVIMYSYGVLGGNMESQYYRDIYYNDYEKLVVQMCGVFLFVITYLAFAIHLLIGLHTNKPDNLKAYWIYSCIHVFLRILFVGVVAINIVVHSMPHWVYTIPIAWVKPIGMAYILYASIEILLHIYTILVIVSLYDQYQMKTIFPANYKQRSGTSNTRLGSTHSGPTTHTGPATPSAPAYLIDTPPVHSSPIYPSIYPSQELSIPMTSASQHRFNEV